VTCVELEFQLLQLVLFGLKAVCVLRGGDYQRHQAVWTLQQLFYSTVITTGIVIKKKLQENQKSGIWPH
jgi:hypothetical protein